jgi:hypothetical protein
MIQIGDILTTRQLGSFNLFDLSGNPVRMSDDYVVETWEVISVDNNGRPDRIRALANSSTGNTGGGTGDASASNQVLIINNLINGNQKTRITDGTNTVPVKNAAPSPTDYALLVRPIGGGDASAANQAITNSALSTINTSLSAVSGKLDSAATAQAAQVDNQVSGNQKTQLVDAESVNLGSIENPLIVETNGAQEVSVQTLPLPAGAATSAAQVATNTNLASINTSLSNGTQKTQLVDGANANLGTSSNPLIVKNDNPQPVSATSLPLPTGASTAAFQSAANTSLASIDAKLNSGVQRTQLVDNTNASIGTSSNPVYTTNNNTQAVSAASLPLPAGAATSSNQATTNSSLSSIDNKVTGLSTAANQTNGSQVTQLKGASKGTTTASTATVTDAGANRSLLDVVLRDATTGDPLSLSTGGSQTTQYAEGSTQATPTGSVTLWKDPTNVLRAVSQAQPLPIGGNVAHAATDSGNPVKVGGVFNSTLPSLSSGQRSDLQLTTRGELVIANLDFVSNPNNINTVDTGSTVSVGSNNQQIITGNATNNSTVKVSGSGNSSFSVQITGTWVGTLQFERSLDNGNTWTAIAAFSAGTAVSSSSTTSSGAFHGNASAATDIRVRATSWTSGVASVKILLGAGTGTITVGNPVRVYDKASGNELAIGPGGILTTESQFSYYTITTATTSVIKTGSGLINNIIILGGTAGNITVYDSTTASGNRILPTFNPTSISQPIAIPLSAKFSTGLTIVTAAATLITVTYR